MERANLTSPDMLCNFEGQPWEEISFSGELNGLACACVGCCECLVD